MVPPHLGCPASMAVLFVHENMKKRLVYTAFYKGFTKDLGLPHKKHPGKRLVCIAFYMIH